MSGYKEHRVTDPTVLQHGSNFLEAASNILHTINPDKKEKFYKSKSCERPIRKKPSRKQKQKAIIAKYANKPITPECTPAQPECTKSDLFKKLQNTGPFFEEYIAKSSSMKETISQMCKKIDKFKTDRSGNNTPY